MRMQAQALEAQLEALEGSDARPGPCPSADAWPCDGAAWAMQGFWAPGWASEDEAGSQREDQGSWALTVCELWPVVFAPQPFLEHSGALRPSDCDAASQPSTDCDGGSSQHTGTDTEAS